MPKTKIDNLRNLSMFKKKFLPVTFMMLASSGSFAAEELNVEELLERLEIAEQRLRHLEDTQDALDVVAAEEYEDDDDDDDDDDDEAGSDLSISGSIGLEAEYEKEDGEEQESELVLDEVEIEIEGEINENLSAELVLLYEDEGQDDNNIEVDIAQIVYAFDDSPWTMFAGRQYVPFGNYESALSSDPLTLDLGEANETALAFQYSQDTFNGSLYIFGGDNERNDRELVDKFGAAFNYTTEAVSFGLGYISDIGDSDLVQEVIENGGIDSTDYVDAFTAHLIVNIDDLTFIAETVQANDSFVLPTANLDGQEPQAQNLEVNYAFSMGGKEAVFAVSAQSTDEAEALDLPEKKRAIALGVELNDNLELTFEASQSENYDGEETDAILAELEVSF
jgi:hypothetical protein